MLTGDYYGRYIRSRCTLSQDGYAVKIKLIHLIDGAEIPAGEWDLKLCFDESQAEDYADTAAAIEKNGMAYIGGGAAPLFLAVALAEVRS